MTNLTNAPAEYHTPAWSPDGTKLAFQLVDESTGVQIGDLYVMNADGSGRVNINSNPAYDTDPTWSPDGAQIAFTRGRPTAPFDFDIFVMNADGSNQRSLTKRSLAQDEGADWSPR